MARFWFLLRATLIYATAVIYTACDSALDIAWLARFYRNWIHEPYIYMYLSSYAVVAGCAAFEWGLRSPKRAWMLAILPLVLHLTSVHRHGMRYGTHQCPARAPEDRPLSIEFAMLTTNASAQRCNGFPDVPRYVGRSAADFASIHDMTRAFGKSIDSSRFRDRDKSAISLLMNMEAAIVDKINTTSDWVVLFEDDAAPASPFRFRRDLECAARAYPRFDMVWLDARNYLQHFRRQYCMGAAGIAWNRNSLQKAARTIDIDGELVADLVRKHGHDVRTILLDLVLCEACNAGILKCAIAPIVVESGTSSTLGWGRDIFYDS